VTTTRPEAPAPAGTRDRLLDAAAELFYREGAGTGVEALCRAAGVSKRSMYQLFESKDEVFAAALERSAVDYGAALAAPGDGSPRERILRAFQVLEQQSASPDYRGCPFVAAAVEVKSPEHPAALVARRTKDSLTAYFESEAERAGVADAVTLAQQLTIAFDGANARAVVQAAPLNGLAVATATALLDHAGVS
jgi:AcrR family transcriptional regulator